MNPVSIAPMIGWTDRNYRYLFRHISKEVLLYTEMIMDSAILYNLNCLDNFIGFDRTLEPPLALQVGGNNPETLGKAVEVCESYGGFSEINLNCGCPSNKAKRAGFGAELMLDPNLVRQICSVMIRKSTNSDISVKCRIGLDQRDSFDELIQFVRACSDAGIQKMIIHARICILCGLSPAQNRTIPPLRYDVVSRLVQLFPSMKFVLNGGIQSYQQIDEVLSKHQIICSNSIEYCTCKVEDSNQNDTVAELLQLFGPQKRKHSDDDISSIISSRYVGMSVHDILSIPLIYDCKTCKNGNATHKSVISGSSDIETSCINNSSINSETLNIEGICSNNVNEYVKIWSASETTQQQQQQLHGVMIGREAYNNPWAWANVDKYYYNKSNPGYSRREALDSYLTYTDRLQRSEQDENEVIPDHKNGSISSNNGNTSSQQLSTVRNSTPILCKPLHNYFHGCPTNKLYKRKLDELLKQHITSSNCSSNNNNKLWGETIVSKTKSSVVSVRNIIQEAIQDTIPDSFLDARMDESDGIMR